jgi:hypothetical protein
MRYYLNKSATTIEQKLANTRGDIMAEERTQDYFDDNSEGHVDTREANFNCDNRDEHLGCDLGIDVMG